jgi:hypothetical protein
MSITASSICLSNYIGLPIDVVNHIAMYVAETEKWITQRDTNGTYYRKVNPTVFYKLSRFCIFYKRIGNLDSHTIVFNRSLEYNTAKTVVQNKYIYNGNLYVTLYTTIEIARNIFDYVSIVYMVSSSSLSHRQFIKGTLYRPSEKLVWNQHRNITAFDMLDDTMYVNHNDYYVQYVWNTELNIGEYIVQGLDGNEYAIEWEQ